MPSGVVLPPFFALMRMAANMRAMPVAWDSDMCSRKKRYASMAAPMGSPRMVTATMLAFRCFSAQLNAVCPRSCETSARSMRLSQAIWEKPLNGNLPMAVTMRRSPAVMG